VKPGRLRAVPPKSIQQIGAEWDVLAAERLDQLTHGLDLSFDQVVVPTVIDLIQSGRRAALDVGCGVGAVTTRLAAFAENVVGVDVSGVSVELARKEHPNPAVTYVPATVEEFALEDDHASEFDLLVANMTLMDVPDLAAAAAASSRLLQEGGQFVFSITHPWFWPRYWEYESAKWFDYNAEVFIEAEFSISIARSTHVSTHVHRPLHTYVNTLSSVGISVVEIHEPMPSPSIEALYPEAWAFPRFLVGAAVKRVL
jgi:2-polyprenyl-3-methyl-5-hydroxy-6-metoxy-1,4-benzoquinol methylase